MSTYMTYITLLSHVLLAGRAQIFTIMLLEDLELHTAVFSTLNADKNTSILKESKQVGSPMR